MNEIVNMIRRLVSIQKEMGKLQSDLVKTQEDRIPCQSLQKEYEGRARKLGIRFMLWLFAFFAFIFLSLTIPEVLLPGMYCGGVGIWYLILNIINSRMLVGALKSEKKLIQRGTGFLEEMINLQSEQNNLMDKIEATEGMI